MSKTAERVVLVVLAVGLVCGLGVGKEPPKKGAKIDALVASGMKSYKAGKINEAITTFQKVISELQALVTGKLEQYLPTLPPVWVPGKIKSDSIAMSGQSSAAYSTVRRTYTRTTDKARVDITLTNNKQTPETFVLIYTRAKDGIRVRIEKTVPPNTTVYLARRWVLGKTMVSPGSLSVPGR